MAWRCNNCKIVYDENPDKCESCGSTVLEQTDFGEVDEDVIMGRNVENGEKSFWDRLKFWKKNY